MSGTVPLARRNLMRQRVRFALSVGGVGMALLLVLALEAIYSGDPRPGDRLPRQPGAPLIASQRGVKTMHMSSSTIPRRAVERLGARPAGRAGGADPVRVAACSASSSQVVSYLIGYRGGGGPWAIVEGPRPPARSEIVLDEQTADRLGRAARLTRQRARRRLRIVGLARRHHQHRHRARLRRLRDVRPRGRAARLGQLCARLAASGLSPESRAALERDYPADRPDPRAVLRATSGRSSPT